MMGLNFEGIIILITFLIIFYFLYQKDKRDREKVDTIIKTFENTVLQVLVSIEKTNNKFYEMAGKIQIEHFKQLSGITDKQGKVFSSNTDKILKLLEEKKASEQIKEQIEKITKLSSLDEVEKNSIEKEEEIINPLEDIDPATIGNIKNIQFEGQEEIFPLENA